MPEELDVTMLRVGRRQRTDARTKASNEDAPRPHLS